MTDLDELRVTLEALGRALEDLGICWAIGGSLASAAYGEPRATNDVDIIAELDPATARELAARLGDTFHADADVAAAAARDHASFNVIDERSFIKVDIFVPSAGPLGAGQLTRRRALALFPDLQLPVLGPEDVVLQKLRWYRLGGEVSDRQWRDILSVLRAQQLDDDYLDRVAAETQLAALLQRARNEAAERA